jgi:hypothetical protein
MDQSRLLELDYVILPNKLSNSSSLVGLHNRAYEYWAGFWENVFVNNGLEHPVKFRQDFCRSDLVCLLLHGEKVVGMHLCEFLNLNQCAFRDHEYFGHHMGGSFIKALDEKKIDQAMIMTYLTIDPEWRKSKTGGVSLAAIMMSLATKVQCASGAGANLGRAREDVGVSNILIDLGGSVIHERLPMHNTPVSVICIFSDDVRDLSDTRARQFANQYWAKRMDFSGLFAQKVPVQTFVQAA